MRGISSWRSAALVARATRVTPCLVPSVQAPLSATREPRAFGSSSSAAGALAAGAAQARRHGRAAPKQKRSTLNRNSTGDTSGSEAREKLDGVSLQLRRALQLFDEEVCKPEDDIDLLRAASLLGLHADPTVDLCPDVEEPLAKLREAFKGRAAATEALLGASASEAARLRCLAASLCAFMSEQGFRGCARTDESYYCADNSLMHKVLANRSGIPITLSLLYMEVARAGGLELRGVNFPGHFLLGFGSGPSAGLLDAFTNDVIPEEKSKGLIGALGASFPLLPKRAFLMRMLMNLKGVYQRDGNLGQAARVVQYARRLEVAMAGAK